MDGPVFCPRDFSRVAVPQPNVSLDAEPVDFCGHLGFQGLELERAGGSQRLSKGLPFLDCLYMSCGILSAAAGKNGFLAEMRFKRLRNSNQPGPSPPSPLLQMGLGLQPFSLGETLPWLGNGRMDAHERINALASI